MRILIYLVTFSALIQARPTAAQTDPKHRLIVLTDIEADTGTETYSPMK